MQQKIVIPVYKLARTKNLFRRLFFRQRQLMKKNANTFQPSRRTPNSQP